MAKHTSMKKHVIFSLLTVGLSLLSVVGAKAFETAQGVAATPITAVPFTITTSGNYYLPANLVFNSPAGAAITIIASEVYLDLNGRTLSSSLGTSQNMGVLVFNQVDVTIQNGDIDGFQYGVYLAPNSTDNNRKNVVDNVRFNNDGFGVVSVSGQSNWIKNCIIDGGDVGLYIIADLGGTRASNNIFEAQKASEFPGLGMAIVVGGGSGTYFDNNLISKGSSAFGQVLGTADKFRFETFVGGAGHIGGVDQLATSL
jgi:Right handed beta helix region